MGKEEAWKAWQDQQGQARGYQAAMGQSGKPKKGCPLFILAILGLSTASGLQAAYVAYSLVWLAT